MGWDGGVTAVGWRRGQSRGSNEPAIHFPRHLFLDLRHMASPVTTTPPPRRPLGGVYACAACNGQGVLDEGRYLELIETPGPLFLPVSQRPTIDRESTPPYVLTVTSKNAKRERERRRRQDVGATEKDGHGGRGRAKRRKSAQISGVTKSPAIHPTTEPEIDTDVGDVGRDGEGDDTVLVDDGPNQRMEDRNGDAVNDRTYGQADESTDNQANDRTHDLANDQNPDRTNDQTSGTVNDRTNDPVNDHTEDENDRVITPSPQHGEEQEQHQTQTPPSCHSVPTSTPVEEIGTGSVRSDRADARVLLRLGLGKAWAASTTGEKIIDVVFAVAGPESMGDILGLCRRWREGLIGQAGRDVDGKTAELRADWGRRVPDGDQKSAIVAVHVSAYWALSDDTDDFVRNIVRRGRLADFHDAFDELLRPRTKPNPGWKKKHADVMRARLAEAHPTLDADGGEYRRHKARFKRQLQFGERWARLRREFGRGIFALLPDAVVTNRWIEQTLSATQFDTWLNILKRHNRPDTEIVKRVALLVEQALGGSRPPTRLRLEGASHADVARDYRNPALLLPLESAQPEDELFDSDGAFLDEMHVT